MQFTPPARPVQRDRPSQRAQWRHEFKYDGWRVQLIRDGERAVVCSRNGFDISRRFPTITAKLAALPFSRFALDGELVVQSDDGATSSMPSPAG